MAAGMRATTIDWSTTTISAASFLLHFGLLTAIYSDWCDPVVVDDEVAVAGVVQALLALAPPPRTEYESAPVDIPDPVPETVRPPPRPFVPTDPGWGTLVSYPIVDQLTDPDWSDLGALTLTDPTTADLVKRAKSARAALDAALRGLRSIRRGHAEHVQRPRGSAAIQSALVTSGVVSNAARVVAGMRAGFQACYQRGLGENPGTAGSIQLSIRVGPDGKVVRVEPVASGNLPEAVRSCVTARAQSAEFAAPDDGSAVLQVPVTFFE